MSTNSIKLQLNSEAAIRSIMESDPVLELEIKNKISCAIAKGYEKIDTQVIENSVESLTKVVSGLVLDQLTVKQKIGWDYVRYPNAELKKLIDNYIESSIQHTVDNAVNSAKAELQARIKERIDLIADRIVKQTTDEIFENSVREEVIKRYDMIQKGIEDEKKLNK